MTPILSNGHDDDSLADTTWLFPSARIQRNYQTSSSMADLCRRGPSSHILKEGSCASRMYLTHGFLIMSDYSETCAYHLGLEIKTDRFPQHQRSRNRYQLYTGAHTYQYAKTRNRTIESLGRDNVFEDTNPHRLHGVRPYHPDCETGKLRGCWIGILPTFTCLCLGKKKLPPGVRALFSETAADSTCLGYPAGHKAPMLLGGLYYYILFTSRAKYEVSISRRYRYRYVSGFRSVAVANPLSGSASQCGNPPIPRKSASLCSVETAPRQPAFELSPWGN